MSVGRTVSLSLGSLMRIGSYISLSINFWCHSCMIAIMLLGSLYISDSMRS